MYAALALAIINPTGQHHRILLTPYAKTGVLSIGNLRAPSSVPTYAVEEIALDLSATYDNPFDPDDIAVDAEVTTPSGKKLKIPGFFSRSYERKLVGKNEELKPAGEPNWLIRVCPPEPGQYSVVVTVKDRSGSKTQDFAFTATKSADPGFVHSSPRDHHYFEFENGQTYFPIGANVCWAGSRGTFDYDDWFSSYGKVGANYARLWLSPGWTTFALEQKGKTDDGLGMGQFNLANAWRLDYVLGHAKKDGLYLMLCIDSFNILRQINGANYWEETPQNKDNGGPLRMWTDFWTNTEIERLYHNKLRYLVARYGADPHVFAWEFWNEVDCITDYDANTVREWHQRTGRDLIALDPYHHLISTSMGNSMGDKTIDLSAEIDFVQTHHYGSPDLVPSIAYQQSRKSSWGKPHFVSEIGADSGGPRAEDDPEGLQVHDPIWVSIASAAAGSAMPWWWDNLIAPKNLYPLFGAAAQFTKGIDFAGENFRQSDITVALADGHSKLPNGDLDIDNGPVTWSVAPENRPTVARVFDGKVTSDNPIAGILHGVRNHLNWHNPILFVVNVPHSTDFSVQVGHVSGHGGAALQITMDDSRVLTREFNDPDGEKSGDDLTQYTGAYTVKVPAGRHTIKVENTGADWFLVSYSFSGLVPRHAPLNAWAIEGDNTVIAWLRASGRSWFRVAAMKQKVPPAPPTVLGLTGLAAGSWKAEIWDTWKGVVTSSSIIPVGLSGKIRIPLPAIEKDVAVKLTKLGKR